MKLLLLLLLFMINAFAQAQDINVPLKEADNLQKQLKEGEALEKYKQIAIIDSSNLKVLVKCVELNCSIGARQTDKNAKVNFYTTAKTYADKALAIDSNNAEANYAEALVFGKIREIETENKKLVENVKQINTYATKALALNPNHAKANYIVGKWHYEMLNINWFKKAAIKTMYGGLPKADIDTAIAYMEKCRTIEPYFVLNYLDLAKAYRYKNRPAQAIEVLSKMVRLPNRTADDVSLKAEGKKLLEQLQ